MSPRLTLKLLDTAILPSFLVFSVKFIALLLVAVIGKMPLDLSSSGVVFQSAADFLEANSFSNIPLIIFSSAGLFFSLGRLYLFNLDSLNPNLSLKIVNAGLEGLITKSGQGYLKAVVWLTLSLSVTLSLLVQSLLGLSPIYLFIVSLVLLTVNLFFLSLSLERDLSLSLKNDESLIIFEEGIRV